MKKDRHAFILELIEKYNYNGEMHTINTIISEEENDYNGCTTFGSVYQPPIYVGKKENCYTLSYKQWLFDSPVLCVEDLTEIYRKQFKYVPNITKGDNPECTLEEIFELEENYNKEGYSVVDDNDQGQIEIKH